MKNTSTEWIKPFNHHTETHICRYLKPQSCHKVHRTISKHILAQKHVHLALQRHIYPRLRHLSNAITAQRYRAGFVSKCHRFYCKRSPSDLLSLPRTLTAFHLIRFNLESVPQGINNCTKALVKYACQHVGVCACNARWVWVPFAMSFCSCSMTFQNKRQS